MTIKKQLTVGEAIDAMLAGKKVQGAKGLLWYYDKPCKCFWASDNELTGKVGLEAICDNAPFSLEEEAEPEWARSMKIYGVPTYWTGVLAAFQADTLEKCRKMIEEK